MPICLQSGARIPFTSISCKEWARPLGKGGHETVLRFCLGCLCFAWNPQCFAADDSGKDGAISRGCRYGQPYAFGDGDCYADTYADGYSYAKPHADTHPDTEPYAGTVLDTESGNH